MGASKRPTMVDPTNPSATITVGRLPSITPAAFSKELVDPIVAAYQAHTPWSGGVLLDPFAGLGMRLAEIAGKLSMDPVGVEIEPGYFSPQRHAHTCVRLGDSRELPFADNSFDGAITSPAYPNGMSDNFRSNESSVRHCLAQEERILTRDLRWVPCGDLGVGDEIMSFDEEGARRRWRPAVILASEEMDTECVRVHLADGSSVVCTVDHPWLVRRPSKSGTSWRNGRLGQIRGGSYVVVGESESELAAAWHFLLGIQSGGELVKSNHVYTNYATTSVTTTFLAANMTPLLTPRPNIVILACGRNDADQGVTFTTTKANIRSMVAQAQAVGVGSEEIGDQVRRSTAIAGGATR